MSHCATEPNNQPPQDPPSPSEGGGLTSHGRVEPVTRWAIVRRRGQRGHGRAALGAGGADLPPGSGEGGGGVSVEGGGSSSCVREERAAGTRGRIGRSGSAGCRLICVIGRNSERSCGIPLHLLINSKVGFEI